jgi:uncharacterized membrane protein
MSLQHTSPPLSAWREFFEKMLLILTGLSFIASVSFFIAYNWNELGRFFKFILVEGLMLISIGVSVYTKNIWVSRISLFVASFLVGIFMALFGQVYQTQADSWELFFYWALLILPWVFVSRFIASWLLWVGLIEIAIILYEPHSFMFFRGLNLFWKLFLFNTLFLFVWEYISKKLDIKYAFVVHKLLLSFSSFSITALLLSHEVFICTFVWVIWLMSIYYIYRLLSMDIYALSVMSLSIVVGTDILFFRIFNATNFDNFIFIVLMLGMLTLFLGGYLSKWLKRLAKEEDSYATKE